MDNLETFVRSVPNFAALSHADKIRFFGWYCQTQLNHSEFTAADLRDCFARCDLQPPSAIAPFLNSMESSRPKQLLRGAAGYRLESKLRDALDAKYGPFTKRAATVHVDKLLSDLPATLHDEAERAYLDEALVCFRNSAFRAAVVMTWNVAFDHLCQHILKNDLARFNTQLPLSYKKADVQVITKRDDLTELKEHQVLQVCKSANVISSSVYKVAKEKLDRRNLAAHPSGITFSQATAEEFIKDLVENFIHKVGKP